MSHRVMQSTTFILFTIAIVFVILLGCINVALSCVMSWSSLLFDLLSYDFIPLLNPALPNFSVTTLSIPQWLFLEVLAKLLCSDESLANAWFAIIFNWSTCHAGHRWDLLLDYVIIGLLEWTHRAICIEVLFNLLSLMVDVYSGVLLLKVLIIQLCRNHHFRWVVNFSSIIYCVQIFNARIVTLN